MGKLEMEARTGQDQILPQGERLSYLIGGYMATMDSGEPGAISQELFNEIIATFQVNP
jgi:hypothetical protein